MGQELETCGCHIDDDWAAQPESVVTVKSVTPDGEFSTKTFRACRGCYEWYKDNRQLLRTEEDRQRWMGKPSKKKSTSAPPTKEGLQKAAKEFVAENGAELLKAVQSLEAKEPSA